jgi:uncharacterized protein
MKVSYYNVFFPFGKEYILFNTLEGYVIVLDSKTKSLLEKNEISSLSEEYQVVFRDYGIIVEDELNEQDKARLMYERSKYNTTSTALHVITTYACNLACVYCYQGKGEVKTKSMGEKTARHVIQFIKNLTTNNNSKSLGIRLFGGEPLLNTPINVLIAKELSKWCRENDKDFSLIAITNGTLLTGKNVEDLAQYNCSFMVTLDGPKDIHDQRKTYKNGRGTFDDIINGLYHVKDSNQKIIVRINVDENNKDHVVSLFQFLKDGGLNNVVISIKPVFNISPACQSYDHCLPDIKKIRVGTSLLTTARDMNFRTQDQENPPPRGACSAQQISYFTVDPYLRLFKCSNLAPFEKNAVGIIKGDSRPEFNHINIDFLSRDPFTLDECRTCQLVPICCGGCPAVVYEAQGTTHGNVCNKSGFYEMLKENSINLVRRDI